MDVKKVTQKDRYGNQVSFEFESEVKPIDQTAIIKEMMKNIEESGAMEVPMMDHPGEPQGSDTVPAWLTPGEFVVNAEAMRMPGAKEQVEAINNKGRAQQQMQGGSIPSHYQTGGQIPFIAGPRLNEPTYQAGGGDSWWNRRIAGVRQDRGHTDDIEQVKAYYEKYGSPMTQKYGVPSQGPDFSALRGEGGAYANVPVGYTAKARPEVDVQSQYDANNAKLKAIADAKGFKFADGGWITDELLDKLREVESGGNNKAVSPAGAVGAYQWLPSSAKQAGYGVKAFDPLDEKASRKATAQYLKNMQKHHGFTPEETLRAYNWGPGNVLKYNRGTRKDIPDEALNYPGKILGVENIQGVTPHGEVPSAPPSRPAPNIPTPTPKPASVNSEANWWDKFTEALGFDEGGDVPSNVVAPLTDVPKGHQMFGGNQNIAGDVVPQGPEKFEPSFLDKYVLGPKTKNENALTDTDKDFLDKQTSENELLAADQLAEEENQIAGPEVIESVEDDIINSVVKGPEVPHIVDDFKTDDHKKEIVKDNSTEIAKVNAEASGKAQTGPDKNQPGENKSESEVEAKGKEAPKGFVDQAKSALVGAFGDLFDSKELARMAIMYSGSRLLGYSHGGSLQFAAKQYVNRVDANNANHKKYVQDLAKSGKYTAASVQAYNKSKDISDLQTAGVAVNPTGQFKTFYNNKGQKVRAQQVKAGKSTYWVGSNGQKINSSYNEDASQVVGTPEYGKRIKADSAQYSDMIKGLRSQFGTTKIDGKPDILATDLVPAVAGGKIAKWALDNKVPPEYMGSIVENAYHGAIAHSKQTGEKVRDLSSFLNNQYVISQVGDPLLFTNKDGSTVSGPAVSKLMSTVTNTASQAFGKKLSTTQVLQGYRAAWTKLGDQEKNLWNEKATKEETGFMKFIQDDVFKSIK